MKKLLPILIIVAFMAGMASAYPNEPVSPPALPDVENLQLGDTWDLKYNWSDASNPNSTWSYRGWDSRLLDQHVTNWLLGDFGAGQPAWNETGGATHLGLAKMVHDGSAAPAGKQWDYLTGDVLGHAPYHIRWTSPSNMQVRITGSVWRIRDNASLTAYLLETGSEEVSNHEIGVIDPNANRDAPLTYDYTFDVTTGQTVELYMSGNDFAASNMTVEIVELFAPQKTDSWDLKQDWSDSNNPNGRWSYGLGGPSWSEIVLAEDSVFETMPFKENWLEGDFGPGQPAWSPGVVPGMCKSVFSQPGPGAWILDVEPGDIYGHSTYIARWRSPGYLKIKITGNAWKCRGGPGGNLQVWLLENGDWDNNTNAQRHHVAADLSFEEHPRNNPADFIFEGQPDPNELVTEVVPLQPVHLVVSGNDFGAVNMSIEVVGGGCVTRPLGDLDGNCLVDISDLAVLSQNWLQCGLYWEDECFVE